MGPHLDHMPILHQFSHVLMEAEVPTATTLVRADLGGIHDGGVRPGKHHLQTRDNWASIHSTYSQTCDASLSTSRRTVTPIRRSAPLDDSLRECTVSGASVSWRR